MLIASSISFCFSSLDAALAAAGGGVRGVSVGDLYLELSRLEYAGVAEGRGIDASRFVAFVRHCEANYAAEPDNPARIIRPENRRDELGIATRELAAMQAELQKTLGERKRLADLGLAVSKINHDMRNILGAAQLMSDRLTTATDPKIQAFAPRLGGAARRAG